MRIAAALLLFLIARPLSAQEPVQEPFRPDTVQEEPWVPWARVGLFGFGARLGADFEGGGQAVASLALDLGYVADERLRVRLSGELGFLNTDNTYVTSLELVYRFMPDSALAIPYVGGGLGLSGRAECEADPDCPALWLQFALGFEIRLRDEMNWLVEYRPEDAFRRHRVLIGLATRRRP
ncbi:MAG: hypothetical protein JSW43_06120 [Gemmatimonadota bacterium]|nr:MAG: hypothetical protein JSW43_06120 [Gemmatimonadota bacterium]